MKKSVLLSSCALLLVPTAAFAQSTGSTDVEIIVTGARSKEVAGVEIPPTSKAKQILNQEMISRQNPGQTILDTINLVPGVSFQNNDAYGSAGGNLTVRGFDSTRVSLTFDGIQLNDSGNYAIYSNQMLDPELIEQVNVTLGSTDVDSPTASAAGGTINFRSIVPTAEMGARIVGSLGEDDYRRIFGLFNTGEFGPWGTRAWVSASKQDYHVPFNNYGKIDKQQYNAKIWQPLGTAGDFAAVSFHYNQNRNNFFGSLPLRQDLTRVVGGVTVPRIVGPNSGNRYPRTRDERFYEINYTCMMDEPETGVADSPAPSTGPNGQPDPNGDYASCGTEFDRRYNPSNTGNIRGQSRISITDNILLTVDPSFQWVKANGGGTVTANEGTRNVGGTPFVGYIGGRPYFGGDVNGDGDALDTVNVLAPSQTRTKRYGVIAGLRWEMNRDQLFRVTYTLDHARHRQTGEVGLLDEFGEPLDVFPINDPLSDSTGRPLQKRDRLSHAILNQVAGEYVGRFGALRVNVGVRAPFFVRKLNNYCFTTSANGFVDCFNQDPTRNDAYAALNPYVVDPVTGRVVSGYSPPQDRKFKYDKLLPNVGATYDVTNQINVFASYAQGLSVPSTDNLYNSFYFPEFADQAKPKPETTDTFDVGARYTSSRIQAQIAGWFTKYNNRQASAYDPELERSVFRNLGRVDKWGIDGSIAYQPIRPLTLYAFGSWNRSEIKENIQIGSFGGITDCDNIPAGATEANILRSCALTAGNYESGAPKYMYGFSGAYSVGLFELGITAKRTGPRYIFDTNVPVFTGPIAAPTQVFSAKAPAYWLVNLDARVKLAPLGPGLDKTYLQFNVYNLFDKFYVGGFGGGLNQSFSGTNYGNPPFVSIGAPRTIMGSVNIGF